MQDVQSLFFSTNFEDKGAKRDADQRQVDEVNADTALTRFEFIELLVRLAVHKYVKEKHVADISKAVSKMLTEVCHPHLERDTLRLCKQTLA